MVNSYFFEIFSDHAETKNQENYCMKENILHLIVILIFLSIYTIKHTSLA